jgi:hypothetical protein
VKITYFDSWFHDLSTNIIFMVLEFMIIFLYTVKVEILILKKSKWSYILRRREYKNKWLVENVWQQFSNDQMGIYIFAKNLKNKYKYKITAKFLKEHFLIDRP